MCKMQSSFLQRMTIVCRQRSIRREICPRGQSLLQIRKSKLSQPLQHILRPSLALIHNRRKSNNFHCTQKMCSLESSCFHGENPWQARKINGSGCGHVKIIHTLSVRRKHLNEHVSADTLQRPPVPAHLRALQQCTSLLSTFPARNKVRFLYGAQNVQKNARAQAVRGCATGASIFGPTHRGL